MTWASPRNCSGVRSPRTTWIWTAEKPFWRCGRTFDSRKRSNALPSPLGLA